MICTMRPRNPFVSDDAPMTATERGHSNLAISGNGRLRTNAPTRSAQTEAARDDAAQDLRGAALDGELGRDQGGVDELLLQAGAVGHLGLQEGGKLAHPR